MISQGAIARNLGVSLHTEGSVTVTGGADFTVHDMYVSRQSLGTLTLAADAGMVSPTITAVGAWDSLADGTIHQQGGRFNTKYFYIAFTNNTPVHFQFDSGELFVNDLFQISNNVLHSAGFISTGRRGTFDMTGVIVTLSKKPDLDLFIQFEAGSRRVSSR